MSAKPALQQSFWLWPIVFVSVTLLIYLPAHDSGWFLDDRVLLIDNPLLADPLAALSGHRGLSYFSFAIDNLMWGSNPIWSRWVNVAIHLLNGLLAMALFRRLTGVGSKWAALLGLMFLCHPVQTATVNYIIQRMALLSACFALLSLLCLDRYFLALTQNHRREALSFCGLSIGCGVLSIMAKENTALLPLAVPLLAWMRGGGQLAKGWKPALGLWVVLLASVLLIKQGFNVKPVAVYYQDIGQGLHRDFLDDRSWLPLRYFLSQLEVFWIYLGVVTVPFWIGFDYGWPIPPLTFSSWQLLTALLILGILITAFRHRQRYPLTFFGLLWIPIFMGIESSFIPLDPIFLHRLYLAMFGIVLILYEQVLARFQQPRGKTIAVSLLVVWSALAAYKSSQWRNPAVFWAASCNVAERGLRSNLFLAEALFAQGRYVETAELLRQRTEGGGQPPNLILYGEALFFAGNREEALGIFRKVAGTDASYSSRELFEALMAIEQQLPEAAESWLRQAEEKNSQSVFGLYLRGQLAELRRQYIAAAQAYRKAVETGARFQMLNFDAIYAAWAKARLDALQPTLTDLLNRKRATVAASHNDLNARGELANLLLSLGNFDEALDHYLKLKEVAPPNWILDYNLGIAYEKLRRYPLALQSYQDGLRRQPEQPLLLYNYSQLLRKSGRLDTALKTYEHLLRITPDDGRAWIAYAELLHSTGQRDPALEAIERAVALPGSRSLANQWLLRIRHGR